MDYLTLFYALSMSSSPEPYAQFFQKNEQFLTGDVKTVVDFYMRAYSDRKAFPDFSTVVTGLGLEASTFSLEKIAEMYGTSDNALLTLWDKFVRETGTIELRSLETLLISEVNDDKKRSLLAQYSQKLLSGPRNLSDGVIKDTDIVVTVRQRNAIDPDGLTYPIAELNKVGSLTPGQSLVVLAAPGSFKTTFALNMAFQNSIARDKVGAYFYLEDMPDQYHKKLIARTSLAYGTKIHKDMLLNGTDDEEWQAICENEIALYEGRRKGGLMYMSMAGFSNEPFVFAQQMAKKVNEYKIDYLIFDYAQRMASFMPPRVSKYEYLNLFFSTLSSLALGGFQNRPFSLIVLSQLTKDGIKRADKSEGRMNVSDAAEISSLERDAFLMISLWTDDNRKAAGTVRYQVLKSRNSMTVSSPVDTHVSPEYTYLGDIPDLDLISPNDVAQNYDNLTELM